MIWLVMFAIGLILTTASLLAYGYSDWKKKRTRFELADTSELRKHLFKWEHLVLEREGTLRGVKRFANRARFLCIDEPTPMIGPLVGLVALEEVRILDPSMDFNFEQWKQGNWWASVEPPLPGSWVSRVDAWVRNITETHWRHYRILTMSSSSSEKPTAEQARLIRRVNVSLMAQRAPLPQHLIPIVYIGAGWDGDARTSTFSAYREIGFDAFGVFDSDIPRAHTAAEHYAIPTVFSTLDEAVRRAPERAVFDVAVPASRVLDILTAVPSGAAILLHEFGGRDLQLASRIRELCLGKQLTAAVNFPLRFSPFVRVTRSLIEQGMIGDLHEMEVCATVYVPWHLWPYLGERPWAGILYHNIHHIDLVRSFVGEPRAICARTVVHPKVEQLPATRTSMVFDYGDQRQLTVTTTHCHRFGLPHQSSYLKWRGTSGTIKATMGLMTQCPTWQPLHFAYCTRDERAGTRWQLLPLEPSAVSDASVGAMASLMRHEENIASELPTGVEDAYHTMELVEAACRSIDSGTEIAMVVS